MVENQLLFGTYFFLDNEQVVHSRSAYQVLDLFSDFGGLFEFLYLTLAVAVCYVNEKLLMRKLVLNLYQTREKSFEQMLQEKFSQSESKASIKRSKTQALV